MKTFFTEKNKRAVRAEKWCKEVKKTCSKDINQSICESTFYYNEIYTPPTDDEIQKVKRATAIETLVTGRDTVSEIFHNCYPKPTVNRVTALNFASFTNPGGGFLNGASAQEESLCLQSDLYPILEFYDQYYETNRKNTNYGLYHNKLIYTPNVKFFEKHGQHNRTTYCDIISCAAPNGRRALREGIDKNVILNAMISRIDFLLGVASVSHEVDILIIGAFGCGAFGNKPEDVASIFNILLNTKYDGCFQKVIYAIPKTPYDNNNFVFNSIIMGRNVTDDYKAMETKINYVLKREG